MEIKDILNRLEELSNPRAVEGMARFGITAKSVFGVSIPNLRKMAREVGKNQELALKLWEKENRETRILAAMIGEPDEFTSGKMDQWVEDFDSWEVCDQCIMNLSMREIW